MHKETEHELERLIDKDKFTGRAEAEARLDQEYIDCSAVLDKAFCDDSVDIKDYKILDLAARSDDYTITPTDAYDCFFRFQWLMQREPVTDDDIIQKMKKLAELEYLVELEDVSERGIFTSFKLNLDFK